MKYEAFVYCWTDLDSDKLYVGSHKGTIDDGYVCSSKPMMEQYVKRPHRFIRQIVAKGLFADVRKLEEVILKSVDAKNDEQFYNQHNNDGKFVLSGHTEESRKKISEGNKGKKRPDLVKRNRLGHSAETKKRISENHRRLSGKDNPNTGRYEYEGAYYYGYKELKKATGLSRYRYIKNYLNVK